MKEWWLAIFTNLVVIVGWIVVFNQSRSIKSREEIRSLISEISTLVDDIYKNTVVYYSSDNEDHIGHLSSDIKSKFNLLSQMLLIIRHLDNQKTISPVLVEFKLHSTGGYFETKDFMKQNDVPGWKGKLAASTSELKLRIEQNYFRHVGLLKK